MLGHGVRSRYTSGMGLTIHYDLYAPKIKTLAEARKLLGPLQQFAKKQRFKKTSKILTWKQGKDDPGLVQLFSYPIYIEKPGKELVILWAKPVEIAFFVVNQPGSEVASFGLARHEATACDMAGEHEQRTRLTGWNWRVFCKTQYASMSTAGGWENFFKIHDGICRVLDEAKRLGMKVKVQDEARYWENRDVPALKAEIHRWNTMIAAVTGRFKDMAGGREGAIVAPITKEPDFEHLEAQGQHFLLENAEVHVIRLPEGRKGKAPAARKKRKK